MIALLVKSGIIGFLILICSIFAAASFFERLIKIHRYRINTDRFLEQIEVFVRAKNYYDALTLCKNLNSPISRVLQEGLGHMHESRETVSMKLEEAALRELPLLESNLGVMSTVAHIAPLLGLLGTVNGMIQTFQVIYDKAQMTGLASPTDLAGGIWTALLTTALGLSVAIPTVVAYNYIYHQVVAIKNDMERAATKLLAMV